MENKRKTKMETPDSDKDWVLAPDGYQKILDSGFLVFQVHIRLKALAALFNHLTEEVMTEEHELRGIGSILDDLSKKLLRVADKLDNSIVSRVD